MSEYNGYPNWNQWNVSLWLNNDEGLYRLMLDCFEAREKNKKRAARCLQKSLKAEGHEFTPDGARYSIVAIIGAMAGL